MLAEGLCESTSSSAPAAYFFSTSKPAFFSAAVASPFVMPLTSGTATLELELELEPVEIVMVMVEPLDTEVPASMDCLHTSPLPTAPDVPSSVLTLKPRFSSVLLALDSLDPMTLGTVTFLLSCPDEIV